MATLSSRFKTGILLTVLALVVQMAVARLTAATMDGGPFGSVICQQQSAENQAADQSGAPGKAAQEDDCSACLLHCPFSLFSRPACCASATIAPAAILRVAQDSNEAPAASSSRGDAHRSRAPPFSL